MKKCKYCQEEHNLKGFICRVCKDGLYRYNMTRIDQINLYKSQDGKCALCEKQLIMFSGTSSSSGNIDHCHKTNKVRGILCHQCNTFLGYFEKKIHLEKLEKYICVSPSLVMAPDLESGIT